MRPHARAGQARSQASRMARARRVRDENKKPRSRKTFSGRALPALQPGQRARFHPLELGPALRIVGQWRAEKRGALGQLPLDPVIELRARQLGAHQPQPVRHGMPVAMQFQRPARSGGGIVPDEVEGLVFIHGVSMREVGTDLFALLWAQPKKQYTR